MVVIIHLMRLDLGLHERVLHALLASGDLAAQLVLGHHPGLDRREVRGDLVEARAECSDFGLGRCLGPGRHLGLYDRQTSADRGDVALGRHVPRNDQPGVFVSQDFGHLFGESGHGQPLDEAMRVELWSLRFHESTLARMSHRFTAADVDLTIFAALNAVRVLDVLASTPARPDSRSPCENSHLHALASRIGETCGLASDTRSRSGAAWLGTYAYIRRARCRRIR